MPDAINPPHYTRLDPQPASVITKWGLSFCLGNVVKYISRAGHKNDNPIEDLEKAQWYLTFEIERLKQERLTNEGSEVQ